MASEQLASRSNVITSKAKAVFVIAWNRKTKYFPSFHKCLLIANETNKKVSAATTGSFFNWDSEVEGNYVTQGVRPVRNEFDFKRAAEKKSSYKYMGTTHWSDEEISALSIDAVLLQI